ncbi:Wax synthase domain [Dillenia turbinata]|uniref:Wax synthase domain n=1 Tax=Dillenia turbinata TaxID=194707 RepID=A0AAN8UW17_9MAGN
MGGEIKNFVEVWLLVFISLCYCYYGGKFIPKGTLRLLSILPIVSLFLYLPLKLHSMHLGGITSFFIAWLANFKLLLFAFDKGPLSSSSSSSSSISLFRFIALACFPIKVHQDLSHKNEKKIDQPTKKGHKSPINYATKGLLLALMLRIYDYSHYLHPKFILVLYCFHIYFLLEIMLAIVAALARTLLSMDLEPQFNEPYLSTSLQDFWGYRWNIMVTRILRPTVYVPVLNYSTRILGRKWAPLPAVFSTFIVSAIMHELIFYYLGRVRPTWEITGFFLLHGLCLVIEIVLKKAFTGKFQLPRAVTGPLTFAFVFVTAFWLFLPPLLRCQADQRAFDEYAAIGAFLKDVGVRFRRLQ